MKPVIITLSATAVLMALMVFLQTNKEAKLNIPIEGVEDFDITDRSHTSESVEYSMEPPVGGNHDPAWLACNGNVYDEQVRNENAVHSLEHGAVWITYQPTIESSEIEALKKKVRGYTFMSPYPEQNAPIMLSAWGSQLSLNNADDPRIDEFLSKYRQGLQTPEPGATCNVAVGGM